MEKQEVFSSMEPFFDFQSSAEHESSNTSAGTTHNKYKSATAGPVFDFGNNDLLPSFEFQAGVDSSRSSTQAENRARRSLSPPPLRPKRDNPSYDQSGHPEKESVDWATVVATVERTMKKYADNLLHVLEGMSGRLSQLEFNSQRIEHTVQEFKVESANNHGAADGKLRSLENMIREVQRGVQVLRDKQEIAEEQLKLAKLQLVSKVEAPASAAAPVQAIVEVQPPTPKQVETSLALAPQSSGQQTDPAIYHLQQLQNQHQLQIQQQQLQAPHLSVSAAQQQIPQQISQQMPQQQQQTQLQPQTQQQNVLMIHQQQAHQQVPPQHPQQLQLQPAPLTAQPPEHQYQPQTLPQQPQSQPPQLTHQIGQQQAEQPQLQLLQLQYQHLQQQAGQSEAVQHQQQPQQQLQPQLQASSHQPQLQHQPPQQPGIQYQQQQPRTQPQQPQLFYSQQQAGTPPHPMQPQYGNLQSDIPSYGPQSLAKYGPENPPAYMPEGYGNRPFQQPLPQIQQSSNLLSAQMYDPARSNRGGPLALPPPPYHPDHTALPPPVYENYTPYGYRMPSPGTNNPLVPNAGTGGYAPRLPTAQPVTSSNNSNAGTSTGTTPPLSTNQVPIAEVIDKVASMGFSKDQVQVVIRKLTENRQSVDLNIVLDKLMNGGGDPGEVQPQKGWFNR